MGGLGKHVAFGSYLHHGPDDQRHLPGYQPKWGKDLRVETQERRGPVCSELTRPGRIPLNVFREGSRGAWTSLLCERGLGRGWGPGWLGRSPSAPLQDLSPPGA